MVLKALNWLRIDALEEEVGMDISRHKGPAYEREGSASAEAVAKLSGSRRDLLAVSQSLSGRQLVKPMRAAEDKDDSAKAGSVNAA
jgi:Amt family ammonium transporter